MQPGQQAVQRGEAGAAAEDAVEAGTQREGPALAGFPLVHLEIGVEVPDQATNAFLSRTVLVGERVQFVHEAFRVTPTCVRRSPGKENGCNLKPFIAFQRVRHPPGKGAARQPEASLAWVAVTSLVKRRQRIPKPGVEPRNHVRAGAFGVLGPGAALARPRMARSCWSGRGLRAGQRYGKERQET